MASQQDIEIAYDWGNDFFIKSMGDYADFSCALFDGNFSKTLHQAQKDKHNWILKGINFKPGDRILDVGCGCGGMLNTIRENGGIGVGLTLSGEQARYCQEHGLDVIQLDFKKADPAKLGKFDGIVTMGAFEHFCSIDEFKTNNQEDVYKQFFNFCAQMLPKGGRLFVQTTRWGKKVLDPSKLTADSPSKSPERIMYRIITTYPGSWPPCSLEQIIRCAEEHFEFISTKNGRLDYIETYNRWNKCMISRYNLKNIIPTFISFLKMIPRFFSDKNFRTALSSTFHSDFRQIFVEEIMSHERIFFVRK